jgi:hypothetical protein
VVHRRHADQHTTPPSDRPRGATNGGPESVAVQLLHHQANELLHGSYSEKTGKALLTAVAQTTRAAGFDSADVGRHSLVQRYYI